MNVELFVVKLQITKADGSVINGCELTVSNKIKNTKDFYKPRDNRIDTEEGNIHVMNAIKLYKNIEVSDVINIENVNEYNDILDNLNRRGLIK